MAAYTPNAFDKAHDVANGYDPTTQERIDGIDATALRRSTGNVLVVPPVRNVHKCIVFEVAVLDAHGGYYYPSDRNEPADHLVVEGGTHTWTYPER